MKKFLIFFLAVFLSLKSLASVFVVTNTTANSSFSLAYAITQANSHPGKDTIEFNIPGILFHTIISDSLPPVTDTLFINGLSQPGNSAVSLYDLTLGLIGTRGLEVRSPGCSINGLYIGTISGYGLNLLADSAKSIDNTFISDCRISDGGGINISPVSNYSLNSSGIYIDHVWSLSVGPGSTGINIYASPMADIKNVSITNSLLSAGYGSWIQLNALKIDRQNNSVMNPGYSISGTRINTNVELSGYLEGINFVHDTIFGEIFQVQNAAINYSVFEFNQFFGANSAFEEFIGDTIIDIRIQSNEFVSSVNIFDFSGTNQFFDNIYFKENEMSSSEVSFSKSFTNVSDSQDIGNIYVINNFQGDPQPNIYKFFFAGKTSISNLQINNNYLHSWGSYIKILSDTNTTIRNISLQGNTIITYVTSTGLLDLNFSGNVDTLTIANDSLVLTPFNNCNGIWFNCPGKIKHLSIHDNFISVSGTTHPVSVGSAGIALYEIHTQGDIKHNIFSECEDVGIYAYSFPIGNDSGTVLRIDSNSFSESFRYAIGIASNPYNPPASQIGTYTMLGNNIYHIGHEGIYRYSQHDTLSCMTCIPKPFLLIAEYYGGNTTVFGTLSGDTSANYIIEFFSNTFADTGGFTEGQFFIHRDTIQTDASGSVSFMIDIPGNYLNKFLTSTATSMNSYQTSEFSNEAGVVMKVQQIESSDDIRIFPNPSEYFQIYSPGEKVLTVELLNTLGNSVYKENVNSFNSSLDFSFLPEGIYFIKLNFNSGSEIRKILVQKK